VTAVGLIAMVVWRRNAAVAFAIAVLLCVLATTIVRVETLVVALGALAPWATGRFQLPERMGAPRLAPTVAWVAASIATVALVISVLTGGTRYSSMTLANEAGHPVVVRFTVPGQYATFGFRLEDRESGTAWFEQIGSYRSVIAVMALDCSILQDFRSDASTGGWVIRADESETAAPGRLADLPYSPLCAEELRLHREGGD